MKYLIFDMYGTLMNTRECSLGMLQKVERKAKKTITVRTIYKKWRREIEEMINEMNTKEKFQTEKKFFPIALGRAFEKLGIDANHRERMKFYEEMCWGNRDLFPETFEAIELLKDKYKVVIASNSDTKPLKEDIKKKKLKVDKIITSQMVRWYKPHKEFFEEVLKKLKVKQEKAVYIGDSLRSDICGAQQVGMKTILVKRKPAKQRTTEIKPNFTVRNLLEIKKLKL